MSVMDDILKLGFAFLDLLIAIDIALFILLLVFHLINDLHKISTGRLHFSDNMIDFGCKGIVYTAEQEKATGYPATQEGQRDYLKKLYQTVRSVDGHRGIGVFYWEPAWLPIPGCTWGNQKGCEYMNDDVEAGNAMANQALFDAHGNANAALLALKDM